MLTLCIQYRIDPAKHEDFRIYAAALREPVERCGGRFFAYYVPTKIAGPTDEAFGFIGFPDLATYERYRRELMSDPGAVAVLKRATDAGCILRECRTILERVA
jgi:hypothetical protein